MPGWGKAPSQGVILKGVGLSLLIVFSVPATAGEIYRWVDEQGQVHFSDSPQGAPVQPQTTPYDTQPQYTPPAMDNPYSIQNQVEYFDERRQQEWEQRQQRIEAAREAERARREAEAADVPAVSSAIPPVVTVPQPALNWYPSYPGYYRYPQYSARTWTGQPYGKPYQNPYRPQIIPPWNQPRHYPGMPAYPETRKHLHQDSSTGAGIRYRRRDDDSVLDLQWRQYNHWR